MTALPIMVVTLSVLALAYRYYSAFLAAKVCALDDSRITPAYRLNDGQNYHPTHKWVLFGHHFAAISGAGPLVGPVLAAQFGYLPGLLWLVIGVVIGGAVQDFVVLVASVRHNGKSLARIVHSEIGPVAGTATGLAILFVLIIALAGLGIVVVNALAESAWGTYTIAMTIPIALMMGMYAYRIRVGKIGEATVFGVAALLAAVFLGGYVAAGSYASWFILSRENITIAMAVYGFVASVLPVWLLLCPRDYLSSFMKLGTIALMVVGLIYVNPVLILPPLTKYIHGGGPIVSGKVFPFVFITVMCGAISGFHSLVSSGTTPKMISKESHCRPIGYGCMLLESLVGVVALVAVATLSQRDYFEINVPREKFATLQIIGSDLDELPVLQKQVKENVAGRTGGGVSLAVGMTKIFGGIPGSQSLMPFCYHFIIMFEALFILTTIDTGTRIARFVFQEFLGKVYRPFERTDWVPGTILTSLLTVCAWGYFIYTGSVETIWPMFGVANQLLAVIALCVGTTVIINSGKRRYAWITFLPMLFVLTTTTTAAVELIVGPFWHSIAAGKGGEVWHGWLQIFWTVAMLSCMILVLLEGVRKWIPRVLEPRPASS